MGGLLVWIERNGAMRNNAAKTATEVVSEEEVKKVFKNKYAVIVIRNNQTEIVKAIRPETENKESHDLIFDSINDFKEFLYGALSVLNKYEEKLSDDRSNLGWSYEN